MKHLYIVFLVLLCSEVCSQVVWDGGAGTSDWHHANNWSTDNVPMPSDDVIIGAAVTVMLFDYSKINSIDLFDFASLIINDSLEIDQQNSSTTAGCMITKAYIENNGWLYINSALDGMDISANSNFDNNSVTKIQASNGILNRGTVVNRGELQLSQNTNHAVNNDGTFNNIGSICIEGPSTIFGIENQGSFTNSEFLSISDVDFGISNTGSIQLANDSYTGIGQYVQQGLISQDDDFIIDVGAYLYLELMPDVPLSVDNNFSVLGMLNMGEGTQIPLNQLYGGSDLELMGNGLQIADGSHILGGYSRSSESGDVSGMNNGSQGDWWIVKSKSKGSIIWEYLYGGAFDDRMEYLIKDASDEYVAVGSREYIQFDRDAWVLKLDANGLAEWDVQISGPGDEKFQAIIQSSSKDYYAVGNSFSTFNGSNHGSADYLVSRIDPLGNIVWDSLYGGSEFEDATHICEALDGSMLITGRSSSSMSGDVTGSSMGLSDVWVLKIDGNGQIQWNTLYGTIDSDDSHKILQLDNGNIKILASQSIYNPDIDDSQTDLFILTLNSFGQVIEEDFYATPEVHERPSDFLEVSDGYIIVGSSLSKGWILKLDYSGQKVWEQHVGGNSSDAIKSISSTPGGYVVYGQSHTSANGDVRDQSNGSLDYWIVMIDLCGNVVY